MIRPLALALFATLLLAGPAGAAPFNVTKPDDTNDGACLPTNCSLRDAVIAANGAVGPDTINLPAGHYTLTGAAGDNTGATGDLDVTDPLTITGAGSGTTTIDSGGIERAFDVIGPTVTFDLSGVTLTGGVDQSGSAIRSNGSLLALTGVVVTNNAAGNGTTDGNGEITVTASAPTTLNISRSTFSSNTSGGGNHNGFGVISTGGSSPVTANITDSTFTSNTIGGGGSSGQGFGVIDFLGANPSSLTVTRSVFDGNTVGPTADGFGTIDFLGAKLSIADSTFSNNHIGGGADSADGFGAIDFLGTDSLTVTGTTISGNVVGGGGTNAAGFGGGIDEVADKPVTITNSTITGNTAGGPESGADGSGGGIDTNSHTVTITNSTIAGNTALGAGAAGGGIDNASTAVTVLDTILAGNTAAGTANNCSQTLTSGGNNIDDGSSCGLSGTGDQHADPKLASLGKYGGLTQTEALLPGSPAIDHGSACAATDQRGLPRPYGPACDIGAYEFAPPQPSTGTAGALKATSAVLGGSVVPNLRDAVVHFDFGTTPNYGSQTPTQDLGGGLSGVAASSTVSGLTPGTTYHYRLVASGDDTATGADATFKTPLPTVGSLRIAPSAFPAAKRGGSTARRRKTGATVRYQASDPGKATFKVLRPTAGRRQGKSCRKPSAHHRRGRKCTRFVSVGSFSRNAIAGANKFHFTGRVRRHKLRPGSYRLQAKLRVGGKLGPARTARFKVIA